MLSFLFYSAYSALNRRQQPPPPTTASEMGQSQTKRLPAPPQPPDQHDQRDILGDDQRDILVSCATQPAETLALGGVSRAQADTQAHFFRSPASRATTVILSRVPYLEAVRSFRLRKPKHVAVECRLQKPHATAHAELTLPLPRQAVVEEHLRFQEEQLNFATKLSLPQPSPVEASFTQAEKLVVRAQAVVQYYTIYSDTDAQLTAPSSEDATEITLPHVCHATLSESVLFAVQSIGEAAEVERPAEVAAASVCLPLPVTASASFSATNRLFELCRKPCRAQAELSISSPIRAATQLSVVTTKVSFSQPCCSAAAQLQLPVFLLADASLVYSRHSVALDSELRREEAAREDTCATRPELCSARQLLSLPRPTAHHSSDSELDGYQSTAEGPPSLGPPTLSASSLLLSGDEDYYDAVDSAASILLSLHRPPDAAASQLVLPLPASSSSSSKPPLAASPPQSTQPAASSSATAPGKEAARKVSVQKSRYGAGPGKVQHLPTLKPAVALQPGGIGRAPTFASTGAGQPSLSSVAALVASRRPPSEHSPSLRSVVPSQIADAALDSEFDSSSESSSESMSSSSSSSTTSHAEFIPVALLLHEEAIELALSSR